MKYTIIILLCFLTSALIAQVNISDTISISENDLDEVQVMDTVYWKPVFSCLEPKCEVYRRHSDSEYSILFQGKDTCYLVMPRMGYLNMDSTCRVDVNGKGSKELLLYFEYEYSGGGEFSGYETYGSGILVYDLDSRTLLLQYELNVYDSKTSAYFLDSLGNEVFVSEEQRDSILEGTADEYIGSLTYNYTTTESHFTCNYKLKNKKFTLDCLSSEPQDATNNSEEVDSVPMKTIHMKYKLKEEYWILQKK